MSIVPAFVLTVITAHLESVLRWCSAHIYQWLIVYAADELLVRVHAQLDVSTLEQACAPYHHPSGPGAPPIHRVAQLVRALLVKYLCGWSLRELEWHIRFNLLVKWFVGYALFEVGPDARGLAAK